MRELTPDTKIKIITYPDFEGIYIKENELIEDAQKYNVGDISKKTGLQKCMVNGRIVWLLPHQNGNFTQAKMQKADLKLLAKSAKKAKPDGKLNSLSVQGAKSYMNYIKTEWKKRPVKCPFFNNAKIRLDSTSYKHLFETHGVPRPSQDVIRRAKLLPYVRDVIERSGKPAEHYIENGKESYSIIGRANINGKDTGIKVIISLHRNDNNYYYLSVMDLKKI